MSEVISGPNLEIRRKNFQGCLPIQVIIEDSEIYMQDSVPTYYVMQPRMSYLFLLTPKLTEFYSEYFDPSERSLDDYWYSFKGYPLRYDIPIGVLYDTLVEKSEEKKDGTRNLPFKIAFHYNGFPSKILQKGMIK